ncbi:MAG: hypothetical protein ACREP9_22830 [Candidatus Dormibacteraceae bacterium]
MNSISKRMTYSGSEFAKALADDSLPNPSVTIFGFLRASPTLDTLEFSLGTSCRLWVSISVDAVDRIERIGRLKCGDHVHEYVQLSLKEDIDQLASALAKLLAESSISNAAVAPQASAARQAQIPMPPIVQNRPLSQRAALSAPPQSSAELQPGICNEFVDGQLLWSTILPSEYQCAWNTWDLQRQLPGHSVYYTWGAYA